jgi:cytosine/adenosine deaminase-related metal-dependent hydrolase
MLLTGDWVFPISSPPIAGGGVLVSDGQIAEVGPAAQLRARYPEEPVREFPGCALLPGFVNTHTHLDYSAFRGFRPSRGFMRWIIRLTRARMRLDLQDLEASALWGAHECLRQGVTSIADTSYGGSTVARAAEAAGLRARVYLEVFGLDDSHLEATMQRLEAARAQAQAESGRVPGEGQNRSDGAVIKVEWGISPHAPYTVSQALYGEVARYARAMGMRMASHIAESKTEVRLMGRGSGLAAFVYKVAALPFGRRWKLPRVRSLQYVAEAGALGPDMLAVHAVQLDGEDIATLACSGAAVAHCPRSNQRLGCGLAPVAELRAAGITVGLGTDSLASNDSLDMLAEMRAALQVSRERAALRGAPAPLASGSILQMATLDGARALGWDRLIGSLQAGKRADLTVVRLPASGPVAASADDLALAIMDGQVRLTMVDGKVVYESAEGARDSVDVPSDAVLGMAAVRKKLGLRD